VFGKTVDKTVEGVEKALKEQKGVSDPCVVLIENEDMNVFLYFNIVASIKHGLVEGSTIPDPRDTIKTQVFDNMKDDLFNKVQATSYCYDALPLIVDSLMKKYCLKGAPDPSKSIPDMPIADEEKKKYISSTMGVLEKAIDKIASMQSARALARELDKEYDIIVQCLAKYVKAIPELKKIPYPGPVARPVPKPGGPEVPVPGPNPDVEKLKKQLAEKNALIEAVKKEMKEAGNISGTIDDDKLVEELKKLLKKSKTAPRSSFFNDPGVKGKEMTFKPEPFTFENGEERVVFKNRPSTYKFFFILNAEVERLHLDTTKPVTCVIVDTEHHCSTDQPQETPFTREYNMPKGEDYYLCKIKDHRQ